MLVAQKIKAKNLKPQTKTSPLSNLGAFFCVIGSMAAALYSFSIEKGVDFSISLVLQRANGDYVDLTDTGVCVHSDIVEFYGLPPITGFTIEEILPSGVKLSLSEEGTQILPFDKCYYDVVLNTNGASERLIMGEISTSEAATTNISC
jgi:hypothetical protein